MHKLLATFCKEILLLLRDRTGMVVLFVMPAILVVVISLLQENMMKTLGETGTRILFIDRDRRTVGRQIENMLKQSGLIEIVKELDGEKIDKPLAIRALLSGDYQLCVIVPEGMSEAVEHKARQYALKTISMNQRNQSTELAVPDIEVLFDPVVLGGFRSAMLNSLQMITLAIETEAKMKKMAEFLPEKVNQEVAKLLGPLASPDEPILKDLKLTWDRTPLVNIKENDRFLGNQANKPSTSQQNVPAWALFGMFFIIVPMAGGLIKERNEGVFSRLLTMPVSYLSLVSGKITAYLLISVIQFGLILLIGKYLLPYLGIPGLEMGSAPLAVAVTVLCAALAATGLGILLGTAAVTYEQASMFGPIAIVLAAAIGGIMFPIHAMPKIMQKISVLSPLAWGHEAFLDIFVRQGNMENILPEAFSLILFFMATLIVSWIVFFRRIHEGP